jgi:hypothetical protein
MNGTRTMRTTAMIPPPTMSAAPAASTQGTISSMASVTIDDQRSAVIGSP